MSVTIFYQWIEVKTSDGFESGTEWSWDAPAGSMAIGKTVQFSFVETN